ncbi:MAG: D-aminoacyl-tRNA deacylase [Pseudomonadales bacterium]
MKALVQRVSEARVEVDGEVVGQISRGLLVLLGVESNDDLPRMRKLMDKCLSYRIFSDSEGKMNLSVKDIEAEVLLVSQFTLCADTRKGLRPSFSRGATPVIAEQLYDAAATHVANSLGSVQTGRFAADMKVHLVNDGPVTFMLDS